MIYLYTNKMLRGHCTMNKYYNLLKRVIKLEKLIYNKLPKFESLGCYKQDGEIIDADGEDEITSILEDKIKVS